MLVIAVFRLLVTPQIRAYMIDGRVDPTAKGTWCRPSRAFVPTPSGRARHLMPLWPRPPGQYAARPRTALTITGTGNSAQWSPTAWGHGRYGGDGSRHDHLGRRPGWWSPSRWVATCSSLGPGQCREQNTAEIVAVNSIDCQIHPCEHSLFGSSRPKTLAPQVTTTPLCSPSANRTQRCLRLHCCGSGDGCPHSAPWALSRVVRPGPAQPKRSKRAEGDRRLRAD